MSSAPTGTPVISFRSGDLGDELAPRTQEGESLSMTARRDLERYYHVLRVELRKVSLSVEEAALVCDAIRGTLYETQSGATMLWAGVEDAIRIEQLDEKWRVDDAAVLVAKLRSATIAQQWAVIDAAEQWWARDWPDSMSIADSLRAVDLTRDSSEIVPQAGDLGPGDEWKAGEK